MKDNNEDPIEMPKRLEYYTADEVAETIDYHKYLPKERADELYRELWRILASAKNKTPLGGDGSNGTVETPCGRLDSDNDDKAPHWWDSLDRDFQSAIVQAVENDRF